MKVDKIRGTQPLDPNFIWEQTMQPAAENAAGGASAKETKEPKPASNLEKVFTQLGNILSAEPPGEEDFGLLTIPVSETLNEGANTSNLTSLLSRAFSLLNATDTLVNGFYPSMTAPVSNQPAIEVSFGGLAASQSMDSLIQGLIARADLLEQILNMTPTPDNQEDPMLPLLRALLGILQKYGVDMDKLVKEIEKKKPKSTIKIMPDANIKEGYAQQMIIS